MNSRSKNLQCTLALLLAFATAMPSLAVPSRPEKLPVPAKQLDPTAPLPRGEGTYRVLLPPDFPRGAPYPVLYFLHDFFGDSGILWRTGAAAEILRREAAGEMPPLVLVAPDGRHGYWSDAYSGRWRYETWVTDGLRRQIEAAYPVRQDRGSRAVAGISMGGYGAAKLALKHPELYASAGSLSGALIPFDWESVRTSPFLQRIFLKRVFGRAENANNLEDNDLVRLLARPWGWEARPLFELRAGSEDKYDLDQAAAKFADAARAQGFTVGLTIEPGGHDWKYWRQSAADLVAWHARAFTAAPAGGRS